MTDVQLAYALLVIAVVGGIMLVVISVQRDRIRALEAELGCRSGRHDWALMTSGRAGFVRWYGCRREGCLATRFVKGGRA